MKFLRVVVTVIFLSAFVLPGMAVAQSPPASPPGWKLELREYLMVNGNNAASVGRPSLALRVSVTEYSPSNAIQVTFKSANLTKIIDGLKPAPGNDRVIRWIDDNFLVRFIDMKDSNKQALIEVWIRD